MFSLKILDTTFSIIIGGIIIEIIICNAASPSRVTLGSSKNVKELEGTFLSSQAIHQIFSHVEDLVAVRKIVYKKCE